MKSIQKLNRIAIICIAISSMLLSSCITRYLYKGNKNTEYFQKFLISEKTNDIVFIGKKYHYVLRDNNKQIAEFIKPEWKHKLNIANITLTINSYNEVEGSVTIAKNSDYKLSEQDIVLFKEKGFKADGKGEFIKIIQLYGNKYKPAPGTKYVSNGSLSKRYKANINKHYLTKPQKVMITPITVAADGILILYGSLLFGELIYKN